MNLSGGDANLAATAKLAGNRGLQYSMSMIPKLTQEQREALRRSDRPVPVEDTETKRVYYLVDGSAIDMMLVHEDLFAIRDGIADMEAGRVVPLEELDARIRASLSFSGKK
jgi:hypothetical protein